MSSYATVRAEIKAQLGAVTGIGKLYDHRRHSADWKTFLDRFKTATGLINVCWFSRVDDVEAGEGTGSTDEVSEIVWVQEDEYWEIELYHGFKDDEDDGSPSEYGFNTLVDAIETKFRFLQNLNGKARRSFPLNRTSATMGMLGEVLCHRAVWKLRLQHHI
jgi:hypothetical protein